jgi:hypothetical protein
MVGGDAPEPPRAPPPVTAEVSPPKARIGDRVRIEVALFEPVPGENDLRSAIFHFAFDLAPGDGGWRIVAELVRPDPEAGFKAVHERFGLPLLMAGGS